MSRYKAFVPDSTLGRGNAPWANLIHVMAASLPDHDNRLPWPG
jgi:hypothetical protein